MSKVTVFFIIFLMGIFLGWGAAKTTANDVMQTGQEVGVGGGPEITSANEKPDSTTTQIILNNLLREHTMMTLLHMQAFYDGKDTQPTTQMLETNGQQIASIIGSVYGAQARTNFLTMWRAHIGYYVDYTKALKKHDPQGMKNAKNNLETLANDMGTMINQTSPNISATMVTSLTKEHAQLTLNTIDAYSSKDQTDYINLVKAGTDQASRYADFLFEGMKNGRPEAFQ